MKLPDLYCTVFARSCPTTQRQFHITSTMAANPLGDTLILGAPGVEGKTTVVPTHEAINAFTEEKHRLAESDGDSEKKGVLEPEIKGALAPYDSHDGDSDDHIIVTGADAGGPSLHFFFLPYLQ